MPVRTVVLAALIAAVGFSFAGTVNKPDCGDADFGSYYRAAAAVRAGQTPYQVGAQGPMGVYPYAPAYAYLLVPLTYLDYLWAFRLWLGFNWLATAAAFALCWELAEEPPANRWAAFLLAGVPMAGYLWANLRVGQAAMFVLLACLGWARLQRRGLRFTGGLLLAAAGAVKLAPLVLVPWLVLRRDRRGLAGVLTGLTVLVLLPALWVGLGEAVSLHVDWARHTLATHVPIQTYRPGNQSLLAQLARLPMIGTGHVCTNPENLARLLRCYPLLLAGLAAGLYALLARRRVATIDNLSLAVLLVFMTLTHPRAWRCNFVALLFPCLLLAARVVRRQPGWETALAALIGLFLAVLWPTSGVGVDGWSFAGWLLLGKHFWAALAVALACARRASEPTGLPRRLAVASAGPGAYWTAAPGRPAWSCRSVPDDVARGS